METDKPAGKASEDDGEAAETAIREGLERSREMVERTRMLLGATGRAVTKPVAKPTNPTN